MDFMSEMVVIESDVHWVGTTPGRGIDLGPKSTVDAGVGFYGVSDWENIDQHRRKSLISSHFLSAELMCFG